MRAALICGALTALSCQNDPSDSCALYKGNDPLYSYCVTREASRIPVLAEAEAHCDILEGDFNKECRSVWVEQQVESSPEQRSSLLAFCRTDDCRFMVVDRLPAADILAQMDTCKVAGRYTEDCRGHARQRWALSHPVDFERVAAAVTDWQEAQSDMLGVALGCGTVGRCEQTPRPERCEQARTRMQGHPWLCRF